MAKDPIRIDRFWQATADFLAKHGIAGPGIPSGEEGLRLFATDGRYFDPRTLSLCRAQVYSQNYEDGIIAEIYRRIGVRSRSFLEIGVENGLQNNTRFLLEQGWRGTWVDSPRNAAEARSLFAEHVSAGTLQVIGAHLTAENVNEVLDHEGVSKRFDFLSVDIDQNTTHVWRKLNRKARVACIEYNASLPPSVDIEACYDPNATWDGSNWYGGSLKTIETIGRTKAMSLVGCDLLGVNAFLVASEKAAIDQFRAPFTAENHYETPKYHLTAHIGHPPSKKPRSWTVNKIKATSTAKMKTNADQPARTPRPGLRRPARLTKMGS